MPFSNKDKALINSFYHFKEYGSLNTLVKFSKMNCRCERLGTLLKRFGQQEASTKGVRAAGRNAQVTEKNVTAVDELVSQQSREGQKQTHRSTRRISREMVLTQRSIVQIIHRNLGLKCLSFTNTLLLPIRPIVSFSYIYISRGSVATQLRCGGIFSNHFIVNCSQSVPVKEL